MVCNADECTGTLLKQSLDVISMLKARFEYLTKVDFQLTAKLAVGHHGVDAVRLATVERRREPGKLFKNQSTGELRVRVWRRPWSAILTNAQLVQF